MIVVHCRSKIAAPILLLLFVIASHVAADQIEMQNGDRYVGRLLAFTNDLLVVQSDVLGTVRLPRSKVSSITFGAEAATNVARLYAPTNRSFLATTSGVQTNADRAASFKQLGGNTNVIQQVQQQFLSDAGPEANKKFNE